jgi:hypothetical protein
VSTEYLGWGVYEVPGEVSTEYQELEEHGVFGRVQQDYKSR